jgi:hypothetical protein
MLQALFSRVSFFRQRAVALFHRTDQLKADSAERRERWNQVIAEHPGAPAQHREENDMKVLKSVTMGVLVLATASCASAPPLQSPTVNVTGDWVGTWTCDFTREGAGTIVLGLTQNGSRVTGPLLVTNSTFNQVTTMPEGVVSGDTVLTESQSNVMGGTFSGSFKVSGDKMTGPFKTDVCRGKVDLAREPWTGTATTSRLRTSVLTVEALDLSNRMITLRGPAGDSLTMQVDERVKNLPQVKVGDTVSVAYYESWALTLDGPGDPASAGVIRTAAPGQMPAVFAARRTNIRATVTAIDAGKPSVTFRGPQGRVQEVSAAQDPRILARLKVGETYNVSYTEHLAMVVEKTAKR